ncbi:PENTATRICOPEPTIDE REPEAT-CONTAINING PROTEIN [Salix koriyanagi]|uniref:PENTATRICOPEPTIDE REPEAT-CONTAINING PROTEIN n=1 Tax=Salix koriyanagi TaxID=2511006 RepID=A0A9Q1ANT5_9ROSI|nr:PENTATRICOPEPTIDE REPEAT-CONTAINING PROTEIN [Salix koriyanagi]
MVFRAQSHLFLLNLLLLLSVQNGRGNASDLAISPIKFQEMLKSLVGQQEESPIASRPRRQRNALELGFEKLQRNLKCASFFPVTNSRGTLAFFKSQHKLPVLIISRRSFRSSPETYFHLIETYGRDRALQQGKKLHAHLIINGLARLTHFASKLISFYAEAKQLSDARKLFDKIPDSNIRRWIVLIGAYSRRGFYQEALSVFHEMQQQGLGVNKFVIPSGFAQKGDDAMVSKMFELMVSNGVEPDVISWTSVISGLVQNFRNEAAFDTFKQMLGRGFLPTSATISTVLAASRHLAELEPENAGNNMLMSSLYADAGSWENVSRSKKMMKRKRLKNFPGCSWIEEAS